jgi:hypothetical protein
MMMKIALDTELPDQNQYAELVASLQKNETDAVLDYNRFCHSRYVLAAYDQGRLVGMGMVEEGDSAGAGYQMTVLPKYRGCDLERYMHKLLSVNRV